MFAPETTFRVRQEQIKDQHREAKRQALIQSVAPAHPRTPLGWLEPLLKRWGLKLRHYHQDTPKAAP